MEKNRNRSLTLLSKLYMAWFLIGYVFVVLDVLPPALNWANAAYILLAGITAFAWLTTRLGLTKATILSIGVGMLSYGAEWFGVKTGLWFGQYEYGNTFEPLLFGVPVGIPFAWLAVATISAVFQPYQGRSTVLFAAGGATLAVAFDAVLDPVAAARGFWTWTEAGQLSLYGVPWTNFAAWWVTAFLILFLFGPWWKAAVRHTDASWSWANVPLLLAVTLLLLFTTLAVTLSMPLALLGCLPFWLPALWRKRYKEANALDRSAEEPSL